jgi:septum formation inhibitor-activating ATPase MinD
MSKEDVSEILGVEIIGYLNDDTDVVIATNRGTSLLEQSSKLKKSILHIANILTGEPVDASEKEPSGRWFFKSIFSRGY